MYLPIPMDFINYRLWEDLLRYKKDTYMYVWCRMLLNMHMGSFFTYSKYEYKLVVNIRSRFRVR